MKKLLKTASVSVCALMLAASLAACAGGERATGLKPDPNPYTFVNQQHPQAEMDADMTIDGKFDEARWQQSRWLHGVDKPNSKQSATIDFTTSFGEKGMYIALQVEEEGTNIWVNPNRPSYINSCIEMYMGPAGEEDGTSKTFEFDLQADGTIGNVRLNTNYPDGRNDWRDGKTTWDLMPVIATVPLGGEVNTPECYGYAIEAFFPYGYLEFGGWDVSDPDNMVVGINPVHVFSFNYTGENASSNETVDRNWSMWLTNYLGGIWWLNPDQFFHFGKNGLLSYDYTVVYGGTGKGTVTEKNGLNYVLAQTGSTFVVNAVNGAAVTKLTVNGVDYLSLLTESGGVYAFNTGLPTQDLLIEIDFE